MTKTNRRKQGNVRTRLLVTTFLLMGAVAAACAWIGPQDVDRWCQDQAGFSPARLLGMSATTESEAEDGGADADDSEHGREQTSEKLLAEITEQAEPPVETLPGDDDAASFYPTRRQRTARESTLTNEFDEVKPSSSNEREEESAEEENFPDPTKQRGKNRERAQKSGPNEFDDTVQTAEFESRPEPAETRLKAQPAKSRRGRPTIQAGGETEETPAGERVPVANGTVGNGAIDLGQVDRLLADGKEMAAHKLLSQWYWKYPDQRPTFQKQLDELASQRFFLPRPLFGEQYEIQPGDQLRKVAQKYKLSWQYLAKLNKVDPRKIRAGQKLKVVEGPFSAVVDLSDYELTVHCHGFFVKKYRVGIGKEGSSPLGEFDVKEKLEDPTYYGPNGEVRAHDDPLNPLGERWIDIGDSFGIHGTIEPDSIGRSESRGCIRMLNSDVEEVYDLLTIGSPVRIQR